MVTVPAVLAAATASDPGRPRLTWYGADGERIELSARVLTNWVAKTANLLVEELLDDLEAPGPVLLDVPAHWRSVVWVLAAWTVGAEVVGPAGAGAGGAGRAGSDGSGPEGLPVVVTTDPARTAAPSGGVPLVVMTLAALAFVSDDVPPGALDYNAVVAGFGDELPRGAAPLQRRVVVLAARGGGPVRDLVSTDLPGSGPVEAATAVLTALAGDGSVVLTGPGAPEAGHLVDVERVTPTLG